MKFTIQKLIAFCLVLAAALHLSLAHAGEAHLVGSIRWNLQPKGKWEFEQRLQLNQIQASGTYDAWVARTELEYGLTNDLQVAG